MKFKVGHNYKDILSLSRQEDEFVSWFAFEGSGIGNSGGIRSARYNSEISELPCYIVLITRNISHHHENPWEDIIDIKTSTILYWGDAKFNPNKSYEDFRGNKNMLKIWHKILDGDLISIPPILHFSKQNKGSVKFNGLCVLSDCHITWYEDQAKPIKNFRFELTILDLEELEISWLHDRVKCKEIDQLNLKAPGVWKNYTNGNIKKLDVWSKQIIKTDAQLPVIDSADALLLAELHNLTSVQFEAVVVELFKNLPHVSHKINRTRPTADGGFDFFGEFIIPYPVNYEITFLGEAKKFDRNNAVQPKHVSRLVARLNRGQYGIFVTTSYYTKQTQQEVLSDGYPVKLFSGIDLVKFLHELRLVDNGQIKKGWLKSVTQNI